MNTLSYKTISVNKETAKKEWVVIDASGQVVGRLCSKVAKLLRGKYKPTFTPHVDCGDNVIIINADKVIFTGNKETDKLYTRYTGYPGGQRFDTPAKLRQKKDGAERIIRHAIIRKNGNQLYKCNRSSQECRGTRLSRTRNWQDYH